MSAAFSERPISRRELLDVLRIKRSDATPSVTDPLSSDGAVVFKRRTFLEVLGLATVSTGCTNEPSPPPTTRRPVPTYGTTTPTAPRTAERTTEPVPTTRQSTTTEAPKQDERFKGQVDSLIYGVTELLKDKIRDQERGNTFQHNRTQVTINLGTGPDRGKYGLYIVGYTRQDPDDETSPVIQITVGKHEGFYSFNPTPVDAFILTRGDDGVNIERTIKTEDPNDPYKDTRSTPNMPEQFQNDLNLMNQYLAEARVAKYKPS